MQSVLVGRVREALGGLPTHLDSNDLAAGLVPAIFIFYPAHVSQAWL